MHHYFIENEDIESIGSSVFNIKFSDIDKNHVKAQRLKTGEHITVVDESKNYFELEIVESKDLSVKARIASKKDYPQLGCDISLFQGVSKNTKLEDVLRATTEIGISKFYAVNMKRSVAILKESAKEKKLDRFRSVARSASMQSGRDEIPKVEILGTFSELIDQVQDLDVLLVFWEKSNVDDTIEKALKNAQNFKKIGILIGPEGGISDDEIEELKQIDKCNICTLGNTVLRTETAGIVSVAVVKHVLGSI